MSPKGQNASGADGHSSSAGSSGREGSAAAAAAAARQSNSASATSYAVLPRMSDPAPPMNPAPLESQPMSKSNSAGSNPGPKDGGAGTASPYGTRSRNRTGASRPNYAEDKDIDMEIFEMYPERKEDDARKTSGRHSSASLGGAPDAPRATPTTTNSATTNTTTNAAAAAAAPAAPATSRKPLPSEGRHASSQHHAKEAQSTPATTSAAAHPLSNGSSAPTSKKRKAAAAAAAAAQASSGNGSTHGAAGSSLTAPSRRHGASAQNSRGYAVTNMMSFENCKGRLKDGKMIADDGTVLSVNGKLLLVRPLRG